MRIRKPSLLFWVGCLGAGLFLLGASAPAKKTKAPTELDAAIAAKDLLETAQKLFREEDAAKTRAYIAEQMNQMRLQPGRAAAGGVKDAGFAQPLSLITLKTRSAPGGAPMFKWTEATVPVQIPIPSSEILLFAGAPQPSIALGDVEVVFVGYGLKAPEFAWDDYKGVDVQGKVVLILDGDPQSDDKLFAGKVRLHHGRWPRKFVQAARQGAAGAIVILDNQDSAAAGVKLATLRGMYGGSEYVFDRNPPTPENNLKVRGFMTEAAARRVVQAARLDFDELRRAAERRDFGRRSPGYA